MVECFLEEGLFRRGTVLQSRAPGLDERQRKVDRRKGSPLVCLELSDGFISESSGDGRQPRRGIRFPHDLSD